MAVYTQLTNEQITELLQAYEVGYLSYALGIAQGVENSNYLLATIDARGVEHKHILTLYEKRVNTDELPFFLGLMQHVAERGVACPQPLARRDGALYGPFAGKQAALVSFLQGKSRSIIEPVHAASVGEALGKLHAASATFELSRANALSLDGWKMLQQKLRGRLDEIEPDLEQLVGDELVYLSNNWPALKALPHGVIHADLFPDNVFFIDDEVSGIIDFYFACNDALAYDVAITLNAWCFDEMHQFDAAKSTRLLQAYQKNRPLNAAEIAAIPVLLRGAALRFLLTRAHDWIFREPGALVRPHDPREYAAKLKFHQNHVVSGG